MINSPELDKFKEFSKHVLKWEGRTSKDPKDRAAKCYPNGIHTNKGVTYCTFKDRAASLGITPVTHDRFLKLTDEEVRKFIYEYYTKDNFNSLPDAVGLALTEAKWLSGNHVWSNAIDTLTKLKVTGIPPKRSNLAYSIEEKNKILASIKKQPEAAFFDEFFNVRTNFFKSIAKGGQERFLRGWLNRVNDFKNLRNKLIGPVSGNFFFNLRFIR
jgi:lysozyme family protein